MPPTGIAVDFDSGGNTGHLHFSQADVPANGVLIEWLRAGDPKTREVTFIPRSTRAGLGATTSLPVDVGSEPAGADWQQEWCFRAWSIGGEGGRQ
ncbi:MAG: hypothetical protein GY703_24460 [Gammaproteobacteria bacterium]|nr:hypothetical protein [Gammaproteobacteria bacterium]